MSHSIQKVAAKIDMAAGVQARVQGLTGVFAKLAEQHHEAVTLLSIAASTDDLATRSELWRQVREALLSHEQAELLELDRAPKGQTTIREIATDTRFRRASSKTSFSRWTMSTCNRTAGDPRSSV